MKGLEITIGDIALEVELLENETAAALLEALPFSSRASTWGEEVYFSVPVKVELEEAFAKEVVQVGDVAYWPEGPALCLFFGPTPISSPGEIRPASPVTMVGRMLGDPLVLRRVKGGEEVRVKEGRKTSPSQRGKVSR